MNYISARILQCVEAINGIGCVRRSILGGRNHLWTSFAHDGPQPSVKSLGGYLTGIELRRTVHAFRISGDWMEKPRINAAMF